MVLNCLLGLVGIKGRDSGAQVYVNTLPGISVQDFEKAINNESRSAFARVDELIELAIQEVQQDVQNALLGKYELKTFIENDVIGYFQENQVLVPAQNGRLVGVYIKGRLSPYLKLFLRRLRVQVQHTGTFNIVIYDLIQNKLLATIPVTTIDGQITSLEGVDFEYLTNKQYMSLFIGYESNFPAYKSNITKFSDDSDTNPWLNSWLFCSGRTAPVGGPFTFESTAPNSGTSGLSFDYSLQCTFDEKLCNIKKMLALPIQYKTGALMMKEMLYSRRLNGIITSFTGDFKELQADYENEYALRMKQLFQNMTMPKDLCFCAADRVGTPTNLP